MITDLAPVIKIIIHNLSVEKKNNLKPRNTPILNLKLANGNFVEKMTIFVNFFEKNVKFLAFF